MPIEVISRIISQFQSDDERSRKIVSNILVSLLVKGGSILVGLILVPLTVNYISPEKYGVWLTLSSIVTWFNFFDLGLGNGLRNRLAEAVSKNEVERARSLIATSYITLAGVSAFLICIFFIVEPFINWASIIGVSPELNAELSPLMKVVFVLFGLQFILQLINSIHYAFHKTALVSATFFVGSILSLVFIIVLKSTQVVSLVWLGVAFFCGNLISLLIFTVIFFLNQKRFVPRFVSVSFERARDIMHLGGSFFLIQIAAIVQFQTANVLISRNLSPVDVTEYNIAFKLFNVIIMVFGIVTAPIWSAVTEAKAQSDFSWVISTERKLLKVWFACVLVAIIILLASPLIYKLWIGESVQISMRTSFGVMLYALTITYGMIYVTILNGMGRLKTQLYLSVVTMLVFVPLAQYMMVGLNLGILGMCLALVLINVNGFLAAPIEFRSVMKKQFN